MPRMENKAVSGEKSSPPQDESGSEDMKIADLFRMLCERMNSNFEIQDKKFDTLQEDWRGIHQHVASMEPDARQPRLAMVADGQAITKTRERTEGAATAVQAMHGDSCSETRVDPDPMWATSFGDDRT